ncbi:MAG TPA: penicillin-binding protein activator LpoB [Gemmatimonadota bacterium]|jgi:uncharacterized protein (TIGR02722 family)
MVRIATSALPSLLFLPLVLLPGCASRQVTRVDPSATVDFSGRWNDTDSRLVAEAMIDDALASPWLNTRNAPPAIIVGPVRNDTLEHIPTATFVNDLQRALALSDRVVVVAAADERGAVRAERADQQENARPSTRAAFGAETGADLMLGGVVSAIEDSEDGNAVYYYQVDLTLTDLETNEKVWLGQKKLKKVVARGRYKV